jgi:hypothetical protein
MVRKYWFGQIYVWEEDRFNTFNARCKERMRKLYVFRNGLHFPPLLLLFLLLLSSLPPPPPQNTKQVYIFLPSPEGNTLTSTPV